MKVCLVAIGTALAAGLPNSALAQEVTSPNAASGASESTTSADTPVKNDLSIGDIVVTAQRRAENLRDVPVSVSVLTNEAIAATGITGLTNINVAVPSLTVENVNGYLGLHLRGVGSIGNGPGFENPIALYIDGVYYANQSVGLAEFNNVERIEVLKGPQGTLFGRNATGGLLHIITEDPDDKFDFRARASYGNYDSVSGDLYVSTPLGEGLAMDFAARGSRRDGYGRNLATGGDAYGVDRDLSFRSKLVWKADDFKATLIGDYSYSKGSNSALTLVEGSRPAPGAPPVDYPKRWDINTNIDPQLRVKGGGVSLKLEADLGAVALTNTTAWRTSSFLNNFDFDGIPLDITNATINQKDTQFSNELQAASAGNGPLKWVAGLYFFSADSKAQPIRVSVPPAGIAVSYFGNQKTKSVSPYAQLTYELTDQLNLTLGGRYTWERRKLDVDELLQAGPVSIPSTILDRETFKNVSFRGAVDFKPTPDSLLYVSVSRGFKSGGFNVTVPRDPAYLPEKLTAYEFGQRFDLFDRRVRFSSAFFYYDYKNLQTQVARQTGTGFSNGDAELYGFEAEATGRITRELSVNAALNLLHTKYTNYVGALIGVPGGGGPMIVGDVTGNDLNFAPKATWNAGFTYKTPVGNGEVTLAGTYLHSAGYFQEADNVVREPAYDQFNASIRYDFSDERYFARLFMNNISNVAVRSVVLTIPSGQQIQVVRPPRTYGVEIGVKF